MDKKPFSGDTAAKLGTKKKPAVVHVQTEERLKEVSAIFKENGWNFTIKLEADKPEDITDLEILQNPPKTVTVEKTAGAMIPVPVAAAKNLRNAAGR